MERVKYGALWAMWCNLQGPNIFFYKVMKTMLPYNKKLTFANLDNDLQNKYKISL